MKHLPLLAVLLTGCGGLAFEDAKYARNVDCAFHVLDKALDNNDELIARVLEVGQGPLVIEEFVRVAVELRKSDDEILAVGKELRACIPAALLE